MLVQAQHNRYRGVIILTGEPLHSLIAKVTTMTY
jgi:hypothetical protein